MAGSRPCRSCGYVGRRCALRRAWWRGTSAPGAASGVPGRAAGGRWRRRRCAPMPRRTDNFWLLVAGDDGRRLLQRQRRALSLRRDRAGGAGVQGARDLVGAGRRHPRGGDRSATWRARRAICCRRRSPAPTSALVGVALLAFAVMSFIRLPAAAAADARRDPGRPLREIARQPVFIVAVAACALGYGVMNLLMAATPIAMAHCSHPFANTALVLRVACARHVRAELLHRQPDQALRRAAGDGRRRAAERAVHRDRARPAST